MIRVECSFRISSVTGDRASSELVDGAKPTALDEAWLPAMSEPRQRNNAIAELSMMQNSCAIPFGRPPRAIPQQCTILSSRTVRREGFVRFTGKPLGEDAARTGTSRTPKTSDRHLDDHGLPMRWQVENSTTVMAMNPA